MATRQDYYGYIPAERLDLGKLTSEFANKLSGIQERREKEKEELDQIQVDNANIIRNEELGKSQTFQTMVLNGTQSATQKMSEWNKLLKAGQLSPKEYKQRMNTVMENWGTFANTVKTYDARMAEIQKQQQDGSASKIAISANEFFAQMSDLKDKQIFVDESGNMSMGKIDPNTGQIDPQTIESFRSMALPNNMVFDKVNLSEAVNDVVKLWKPYITEEGPITIASTKKNPGFAKAAANLTGSLLSNSRLAASILADNSDQDYDIYFNQYDFNNKLQGMIQEEDDAREYAGKARMTSAERQEFAKLASTRLIAMKKDATDTYQPVLTEDQISAAKNIINADIDAQLGEKVTEDEPVRSTSSYSRGGGGGGGGNTNDDKYDSKLVDEVKDIIVNSKTGWGDLTQYTGGKYEFKKGSKKDHIAITELVYTPGRATPQKKYVGEFVFENMGKFFGVNDLDKWKKMVEYSWSKSPTKKFNG